MKAPILLENKTRAGPAAEQRPVQKIIVACWGIPAIAAFIAPGPYRFGWSSVPSWHSVIGELWNIVAMWMAYRVLGANSYGSTTVDVTPRGDFRRTLRGRAKCGVLERGGVCYRNVMGARLRLGSRPGARTIRGLVWRSFDEHNFLSEHLPGDEDYCAKVPWHLIPGVF
jgi:hypothetical protein